MTCGKNKPVCISIKLDSMISRSERDPNLKDDVFNNNFSGMILEYENLDYMKKMRLEPNILF